MTYYQRGGKVYARIGTRYSPNRQSVKQFINREKMRHSISLWKCMLGDAKPLMEAEEGQTAYNSFLKANAQLPTIFLTKEQASQYSALLVPGIVVSSGQMPQVEYDFATLTDGRRVVLTNLRTQLDASQVHQLTIASNNDLHQLLSGSLNPQLKSDECLRFYRFEQIMSGEFPHVRVECLNFQLDNDPRAKLGLNGWQFLSVDGRLAIAEADNELQGWAIAITDAKAKHASTQQVITTSPLYQAYTTQEALKAAADTYGNVTFDGFLTPNPDEEH